MAVCRRCSLTSDGLGAVVFAVFAVYLALYGGRFGAILLDPGSALLTVLGLATLAGIGFVAQAPRERPLAGVLCLLTGWVAISATVAESPRLAAEGALWQLLYAGIALFGARLAGRPRPAVGAVLCAAAAVAGFGIAQLLGWIPAGGDLTESSQLRLAATLNHPNNLAGFVALTLPLAVAWALAGVRVRAPLATTLAGLLALALALCLLKTYSRGGQLAALGGLFVLAARLPREGWTAWLTRDRRRAVPALIAALVVLLLIGGAVWTFGAGERIAFVLSHLGGLREFQRWGTWQAAWRMVASRPWCGVGSGCFGIAFAAAKSPYSHYDLFTHAHSWYLQVAAEAGWPALLALVGCLALALRGAARGRRAAADDPRRLLFAGLEAGLWGFVFAGLFDHNVGVPTIAVVFWFMVGLAAGEQGPPSRAGRVAGWGALAAMLVLLPPWVVWCRGHAAYLDSLARLRVGDPAGAAAALDRARRLDPGQPAYDLARADLLAWYGDRQAAIAVHGVLVSRRPSLPSFYRRRLAWLLAADGRDEEAMYALERAVAADPAEPVLRVDLGMMLLRLNRIAEAERHFRTALAMDEDAAGAAAGLGLAALARGRPERAAEWFARGASVRVPRDRVPRFLVAYGRPDPLTALAPERRPGEVGRPSYDGPVLSRVRLRLLEAEARAAQ